MSESKSTSLCFFLLLLLLLLLLTSEVAAARNLAGSKPPVTVLIFGDSTADPGNNNFIPTAFRSNFSPYGRDFINHIPTGRFTNGKLANDFIASYVGVKELLPPYLDPTLSIPELMTGVSFASAGSGYDPLTPSIGNVISLPGQLKNLREYRVKLEGAIGKEKTEDLISNALFIVSAGTNDFVINYFTLPIRRKSYTLPSYMNFIVLEMRQFVQGLLDQGAQRIGVVGLPPMGCLPMVITLYSDSPILNRDCVGNFSTVAREYNQLLQEELKRVQAASSSRIAYMDIYTPIEDMTLGRKYGFEKINVGCCGSGMLEASFMCNPKSAVCANASQYVFWDSIHPSERSYQLVFQTSLRPVIDYLLQN